ETQASSLISLLLLLSSLTILPSYLKARSLILSGRCRSQCKNKEREYALCPNKKKCCVPLDKLPKDWVENGPWWSGLNPRGWGLYRLRESS
uniref:Beta-defensin n=1 Tax=Vombatus ursinus TaxID=29139 RepID=A0A4X2JY17_VOMUR